MAVFVSTRDLVGETTLEDDLISGTAKSTYTEYKDDLLSSLGQKAFAAWTALTTVDLPNLSGSIGKQEFSGSGKFTTLILRGNTVINLSSTDTFTNTLIASGTGYIYVPAALVDSYKAATNWSTYADQFRALEDYTVDGTTTGELDETKI